MKTKISLFIVFAIMAISCSKEGLIDNFPGLSQTAVSVLAENVIEVYPGGDETVAIKEAFELAKERGKGSIVKLMPGTYEIGMIEVREFFGTFTGSGKDVTIVTNLPGLLPDDALALNKQPALLRFVGGDVIVSDLKISLTAVPWLMEAGLNGMIFTDYTSDFTPVKKYIRIKLDNIDMTGFLPYYVEDGYHINGVHLGADYVVASQPLPRVNIDADIMNSYFSKFGYDIYIFGCKNGKFNIGGGNNFDKTHMCVVTNDNVGVNVKIHDNVFDGYEDGADAIDLGSGTGWDFEKIQGSLGVYEVVNNVINVAYWHYGIGFFDIWRVANNDDPRYMKVMVDRNLFNTVPWTSTIVTFAVKNGLFSNNIIAGPEDGDGSVYIDVYGLFWVGPDDPLFEYSLTEGCRFINNIFRRSVSLWFEFDTRNNLTVGELGNAEIIDFGIDNRFNDRKGPDPSGIANRHMKMLDGRIKSLQKMIEK